MKYIKALDSLRAIAVVFVIISHYLTNSFTYPKLIGRTGVVIFFVLSGFLITRILLEGRIKTESTGGSKKTFLKNFYIRRSLRIFPIYYLVIVPTFLFFLVTHQPARKFLYFLTYTANIYYFKIQQFDDYFSHLWTLAIEEQFYLIWPFIILFINKKYLLTCIAGFIAIGIITQCIVGLSFGMYLTYTCFDSLGMGALLAWINVCKPELMPKFCRIVGIFGSIMLILLLLEFFALKKMVFPSRIQISVIALYIVTYITQASYYHKKLFSFSDVLLNNNLLASIGKISYGLYLYHTFVLYAVDAFTPAFVYDALPQFVGDHVAGFFFVLRCTLLLLVATLSWNYIEKPLLRLKKYFEASDPRIRSSVNK